MINSVSFKAFDPSRVPSPCFVVDECAVENNLQLLKKLEEQSGAKVLMALKAFSMFALAPLIGKYLSGTCASGLYEARLGKEEFSGEVHTFSVAYTQKDLPEILSLSDHVVFNSFHQWKTFSAQAKQAREERPQLKFGLRINPQHSEGAVPLYDPCAPGSRLGIPRAEFKQDELEGISGLHFHTLCEQGYEPLDRTLAVIERDYKEILPGLEWVNFGGGHHITKQGYPLEKLIRRIKDFQNKYQLQVYLEPGEAIAIHSGVLVSQVLDIVHNELDIAILDSSATCHMPDTLEMPYQAEIHAAGAAGEKAYTYRLGGMSCLAGDVMGDYSFDTPLQTGQRLMFDDMSHYTMVKTSTFNGVALPAIAIWNSQSDELRIVKQFSYDDFKNRLS